MKYYLIAGEASGDLHGSNLIRELKKIDAGAQFRCWGGDLMEQAGGEVVMHYRDLAFMGFTEVLLNLRTIFKNLAFCREDIKTYEPDVLVLIDYPGFNLRIASWAKQQGLKVVFYISPQVWAWKEGRVRKMRQSIDKMLVILPFEKEYFKNKWSWDVEYVGHPLVEEIDHFIQGQERPAGESDIVALLPGSRKQEIQKKLPLMLQASTFFPENRFIVAKAPAVEDAFYERMLAGYTNVTAVRNQTYPLLFRAKAALVTSGTATLETALFGVPEVVCYLGNSISYLIAKRLIKVKYISLVNLIMDRPVVTELIQHDLTVKNIREQLSAILADPEKIRQIKTDYAALKKILGEGGNASAKAARSIYILLAKEWIA
jgi:lipid-A-disaccharide synthase